MTISPRLQDIAARWTNSRLLLVGASQYRCIDICRYTLVGRSVADLHARLAKVGDPESSPRNDSRCIELKHVEWLGI